MVLAVCVVYRGCAIPVAWTILPANQPGAWRREWLRLLRRLRPSHPARLDGTGADRSWHLCPLAVSADCPPGLASVFTDQPRAKFRPAGQARWYWLRELVGQVGHRWRGCGTAFRSHDCHLECTLVAWWGEGHDEPWFILTDLAPNGCDASWYGLRTWCEQSFKCTKRGGWQWQYTQMTVPARAARLWLALAVATLWMVSVGSDLEVGPPSRVSRPAGPQAASESACCGDAPAHTPVSVGVALGSGMPNHRSALTPSLAAGASALAGHSHMCGAVTRAVTRCGACLWIKTYPRKPGPGRAALGAGNGSGGSHPRAAHQRHHQSHGCRHEPTHAL